MTGEALKTQVKIGKICYVNCLPYYHRLKAQEGVELVYHETYPSKLNLALRCAKIDLGPISSLEYLNHQKNYYLLPDFAIGSRDFSGSVLLLSRERIEGLDKATIALTRQSLSSVALLKILFRFKYHFRNRFQVTHDDPETTLERHKATLVIGDEALFFQPKEFVYKYDLSELWWNWTGKPFCFSVWAVRKTFADENPDFVENFCRRLRENLERNLVDIETLIKDALGMDFLHPRFSKLFGYLFNLSYRLDPSMLDGLDLFYRLARRMNLSPDPRKLEFFEVG
ncbi:MAG: menaquinone biosynthesis protein [Candidatus Omnitrophota bacterium]